MDIQNACSREKYWSEADPDLKANRCREKIIALACRIADLERVVYKLMEHDHLNGKIVAEVSGNRGEKDGSVWDKIRKTDVVF